MKSASRIAVCLAMLSAAAPSACGSSNSAELLSSGSGGATRDAGPGASGGASQGGSSAGGRTSASGGAAGGGSGGATPIACQNSLGCVGASGGRVICDKGLGQCVECVVASDCDSNNDCTSSACVPYTPCQNSLDCAPSGVCDKARGRCVECVVSADCPSGEQCAADVCRTSCASDRQCTPLGLLCDQALGLCVPPPSGAGGAIGGGGATASGGINGGGGTAGTTASGGTLGAGGGGGTAAGGVGGALSGAWGPCSSTADCADGRLCGPFHGSGGHGKCVRQCSGSATDGCDPVLPGAGPLVCSLTYCEMSCSTSIPCPTDFSCSSSNTTAGFCVYAK